MPFIKAARSRPHALPQPDDPGAFDAVITGQDLDADEAEPLPKAKPARKARAPKAVK